MFEIFNGIIWTIFIIVNIAAFYVKPMRLTKGISVREAIHIVALLILCLWFSIIGAVESIKLICNYLNW